MEGFALQVEESRAAETHVFMSLLGRPWRKRRFISTNAWIGGGVGGGGERGGERGGGGSIGGGGRGGGDSGGGLQGGKGGEGGEGSVGGGGIVGGDDGGDEGGGDGGGNAGGGKGGGDGGGDGGGGVDGVGGGVEGGAAGGGIASNIRSMCVDESLSAAPAAIITRAAPDHSATRVETMPCLEAPAMARRRDACSATRIFPRVLVLLPPLSLVTGALGVAPGSFCSASSTQSSRCRAKPRRANNRMLYLARRGN